MRLFATGTCLLILSVGSGAAEPPLSVGVVVEQQCAWKTNRGQVVTLGSGIPTGVTISLTRGNTTSCRIAVALIDGRALERHCPATAACAPLQIPTKMSSAGDGEYSLFRALLHLFAKEPARFVAPIGRGEELDDGTARSTATGIVLDSDFAAAIHPFQSLRFRHLAGSCEVEEVPSATIEERVVHLVCKKPGLWEVAGVAAHAGRPQITSTAWLLIVPANVDGDALLHALENDRRTVASWPVEEETRRAMMRVEMSALAQMLER